MIIGVAGKIGAGKDTVAGICVRKFGFTQVAFATKVKEIVATMTGLPKETMYTHEGKNTKVAGLPYTVGQLLQTIGQGYRTIFYPNIWIDLLFNNYNNDKWAIADVRYANEAAEIHRRGGIVIYVEGDPMGVRAKDSRDMNHPSEQGLVSFDYIIENNGSIANLETKVSEIVSKHI